MVTSVFIAGLCLMMFGVALELLSLRRLKEQAVDENDQKGH